MRKAGKAAIGALAAVFVAALAFGAALYIAPKPDIWGGASFSLAVTDRNGRLLRLGLTPDEKYRVFTPLGRLPAEMAEATLLYEDRSFWSHSGVNFLALARAGRDMLLGGRRMGASTLTMQLVRLTGGFDTSSVPGKLRQMWRAWVLERHYGKREILEAYLNLAPYGGNVEGVGAAARVWFGKDAAQLTLPEILALAPVPQNPAARNPLAVSGKALPEARVRLGALWAEGHPGEADVFSAVPLRVHGPRALPREAPHAVTALLAGGDPARRGGETSTTLDLGLQRLVERAVANAVERGRRWGMTNASALLLDWRDGQIRALVGSADFLAEGIHGQVDGTAARRSPGSTLKPFIYALALEQGLIHPQTVLADTPRTFRGYDPENADGEFRGPLSARAALQASRNIPAITLAGRLAPPGLYGFLQKAGVRFAEPADHYGLALVLGGAEMTMRELAGLYAMLPNRGLWREPVLAGSAGPPERLLGPEAAFVALDMLRAPSPGGFDRVAAYWKTGTSQGRRDAWTAGVFGPYVLVVWVGNFNGAPNPGFVGLDAAAPLFFDIVEALRFREPLPDLPRQNREDLHLLRLPVCKATGDIRVELCPGATTETWFIPGVSPIRDSGILREIWIDEESGLRQCRPQEGRTRCVVWEFWPADLRRQFAQAGVIKRPAPPYAPECLNDGIAPGKTPEIRSPKPGVVYNTSLSVPVSVPLLADADADAAYVYWFAGRVFLGRVAPDETLWWDPPPGMTELRAVDDLGRSAVLRVRVQTVP